MAMGSAPSLRLSNSESGRHWHFYSETDREDGDVVGIKTVIDEDELIVISDKGKIIRLRAVTSLFREGALRG